MEMKQMLQLMENANNPQHVTEQDESAEDMPEILDQEAYASLIMGELLQYAPDYLDKHGEDTVRDAVEIVAAVHADEPLSGSINTLVRQVMNYVGRSTSVKENAELDTTERLRQMYESALNECDDPTMTPATSAQVSYSRTETMGDAHVTVTASAQTDAELDEILKLAGIDRNVNSADDVMIHPEQEVVIQSPELDPDFIEVPGQFTTGW